MKNLVVTKKDDRVTIKMDREIHEAFTKKAKSENRTFKGFCAELVKNNFNEPNGFDNDVDLIN